ncbi:MAG TPA: Ldh family oxidoreductase [Chloroflexia bacterium]|nr:Ldh family oxidoreductase [Chloroflexia bacterium]
MKTLTIQEATDLAIDKMLRAGVPREQAEIAAPIYLEGDLCGRPSHGLRHLFNNLEQFRMGAEKRTPLAILNETPVSALVDGGYQHAYYVNSTAMNMAIAKARQNGMAMVACRKSGGSGIVSYYTRTMAEAGFIGVVLANSPASVVPFGGQEPLIGTNPVSVGIPRRNDQPILLDMATSAGTFNQILLARTTGKPLPEGMALGPDGRPTTDPQQALNEHGRPRLLPLGGYKGFGLGLVIELMTAAATGGLLGHQEGYIHNPDYFHALYLAYRPDLFVSREVFDADVEKLVYDLKTSKPTPGVEQVRLPGDETSRKRAAGLERGAIDIEDATYEFLLS